MNKIINIIKQQKTEKYVLASIGVLFLIIACTAFSLSTYYQVIVDGKVIGNVSNQTTYQSTIEELKQEKSASTGLELIDIYNQIELVRAHDLSDKMNTTELKSVLDQNVDWLVKATTININNGETKLVVANAEDGQKVLDQVMADGKAQATTDDGDKLKSISFKEAVRMETANVRLSSLLTTEEAVATVHAGKKAIKTQKVKVDDSLWSIAHENGLTLDEVRELNPEIGANYLVVGQEIKLSKVEPLLNVVTVKEVTREEAIKHETEIVTTDELLRGEEDIKQEGKDGKKSVTYEITQSNGVNLDKKILAEQIIEEPVKKIVEKGSGSVMIASSRSGGGQLSWPITGRINSPYGKRSRGYHTGIDIDGNTGQTVKAAAGGKVIQSGWDGNYGLSVTIDHGNGLSTKYAHMSSITAKKGQSITRGSKVGEVGNTGNSTGPHLHFEVRVNGSDKNPFSYLN